MKNIITTNNIITNNHIATSIDAPLRWEYHTVGERMQHPDGGTYLSYGIHAFAVYEKYIRPVAQVRDITSIASRAERLAEQLNRYQASPIHLEEIIADALVKIV